MPADRIPTTPEQWDAIVPNETDRALCHSVWEHMPGGTSESDREGLLAAASRIAATHDEFGRDVERLAAWLKAGGHCYGNGPMADAYVAVEARRILEDR